MKRPFGTVDSSTVRFSSSSSYGPIPFPNDAQNFAGIAPDGSLFVAVNRAGSLSGNTSPMGASKNVTGHSFRVTFDLDQPEPFFYNRDLGATNDPSVLLQPDGGPAIPLRPYGQTSGILQPGRYTYSGSVYMENPSGPTNGPFNFPASFTNMTLSVAPEPTILPLLAAALPWMLRRRRRA